MSGVPRIQSMNGEELEARPVLGPAGNKARSVESRKPMLKLNIEKAQKPLDRGEVKGKKSPATLSNLEMEIEKIPSPVAFRKNSGSTVSILRQKQPSLSLTASCSSDASSDSSQSRASTGRISQRSAALTTPSPRRKDLCSSRVEKFESKDRAGKSVRNEIDVVPIDVAAVKKRCAWVTLNTDPSYAAFHDEEWGFPVHDDKKLFEYLSFSTALAEVTWPIILRKRQLFRDVFLDFDPFAVAKLNEKKIATPGGLACSLLSEFKLRGIIENARQICKIIDELGSFDQYIWDFVNHKPIVSNFRYPRQVPIKTSKADSLSKDMVKRGFRGVGPTVIYSFMQVAGMANDHLITCFRHQLCTIPGEVRDLMSNAEDKQPEDCTKFKLSGGEVDDLSLLR